MSLHAPILYPAETTSSATDFTRRFYLRERLSKIAQRVAESGSFFALLDAAVRYDFSARGSAALRVENLFNAEIESGRSADGLISLGAPRLVSLQIRWQL